MGLNDKPSSALLWDPTFEKVCENFPLYENCKYCFLVLLLSFLLPKLYFNIMTI